MSDGGTWQPPQPGPEPLPPPQVEVEPAPTPPGRSRGKVIVAAVGAVAIVAAGVFAITRFTGDADAGGAATPEDVGLGFLAALENEDVLAMADLLLPGERETLREPAVELVAELQRLEVLSEEATLDAISGIDFVIEDESVGVDETNVEDIVNLQIDAAVTSSVDGEALPIGDWIRDEMDMEPGELDVEATTTEPGESMLELTVVREDGRWYLSLFHTIAETARQDQFEVPDIPAEGVTAAGGDSPEAAMDVLLDAVEQLDLEAMIAALNPNEFQALQRYAPIFLGDAQDELDAVDVRVDVDDRVYTVAGSGDTRSIALEAFSIEIAAEGETVSGELRDGCFVLTVDDEVTDSCEVAGEIPDLGNVLADPEPIEDLLESLQETFADYEDPGLIVEQVDGQWYVSPMATVTDQVLAVVGALTREEIEDLRDQVTDALDVLGDLVIGGTAVDLPVLDDYAPPGEDEGEWSSFPPDESLPPDPAEGCYLEDDPLAAAACFQALLDAGTIETYSFPWYLRFPDCGLAEVAWSGDYYSLPDDQFVSIVTEVAPCFQALIAAGELDEFDVPGEIARPDCLVGRNSYTATDEAYLDAFNECAYS